MRFVVALAAAMLAGCAQPGEPHLRAAFVNAPDPQSLLPGLDAFPEGYALGYQGLLKDPPGGAVDGASAIFEKGNASTQHRVVVGVLRFGTSAEAEAMRAQWEAQMPRHESGPRGYVEDSAFGTRENVLAWVASTTMGGASEVDAAALLARVLTSSR